MEQKKNIRLLVKISAMLLLLTAVIVPAQVFAEIQSLGQINWPGRYIANNSGKPAYWGGSVQTIVAKYTSLDNLVANLGFSLDLDSSSIVVSKNDGPTQITLSNTIGEWAMQATFAATPIIKYGNEWSWIGSAVSDPTAEEARPALACCSWNPNACGVNYGNAQMVAFKCSRDSINLSSSDNDVATANLLGNPSTNKINTGSETTSYTKLESRGGNTVYTVTNTHTNNNAFYYPESQEINIAHNKNGTAKINIDVTYSCRATVLDSYCSYKHVPGVWEYLYHSAPVTDTPIKTVNLSSTLDIISTDNKKPEITIDIDPKIVYNRTTSIDNITTTINATDPDGHPISEYEFKWYKILPDNPSTVIPINDGSFDTNNNVQTLVNYKTLPVGTIIFARGRAKDNPENDYAIWSDFVRSENVLVAEDGLCGTAHGNFSPTQPTEADSCLRGTKDDPINNGTIFSWTCKGSSPLTRDAQCNTIANPAIDGTVSCTLSPIQAVYDGTEDLTFNASVNFDSTHEGNEYIFSDHANVEYNWGGDMPLTPINKQTKKPTNFSILADNHYEVWVEATYFGEITEKAYCGGKITVSRVPEIKFNIPTRIANEAGSCIAEWEIEYGTEGQAKVTCQIINNFGQSEGRQIGPISSDDKGTENVRAGNSYKLKCITDVTNVEVDTEDLLICVDPNITER